MTKKYSLDELVDPVRTRGPKVLADLGVRLDIENAELLVLRLKDKGLDIKPFDFPGTIRVWQTNDENNIPYKRVATKQLITTLAKSRGVDYRTFEGFRQILDDLNLRSFQIEPINGWGTSLGGMLVAAYDASPSTAVLDLVYSDPEFQNISKEGLRDYDFKHTPKGTWTDTLGKPTDTAREVTKQLIRKLAQEKGVDYRTFEGFRQILEGLTQQSFRTTPINDWGTTGGGMIKAYSHSPSKAVLDLVYSDPEFEQIAEKGLEVYDFQKSPRFTWADKSGKPTDIAREATKALIRKIAETNGIDYRTFEGFKQILGELTKRSFDTLQINDWGTTVAGMVANAYSGSSSAAVLDLLGSDNDFRGIKKKVIGSLLSGFGKTRKDRAEGMYSSVELKKSLKVDGLDLAEYGFYSFAHGEKQTVRELLAEEARKQFGGEPIAYFGLEGPTFGSYFSLARFVNIDSKASLCPERSRRSYNVMERIKRMKSVNKLLNGSSLYSIELFRGEAEQALEHTEKRFDLVFLDWLGHLSPSGIRELDNSYGHLKPNGIIAATIKTNPLSEKRYHLSGGLPGSQDECILDWAGRKSLSVQSIDYVGGDKRKTPMTLYICKKDAA